MAGLPPSPPPGAHPGLIVPVLRYRDARAMIDWLCQSFGFEIHALYEDEQGRVGHAELTYGDELIMLSSVLETPFSRHMVQPDEVGGRETISIYVVVPNADLHYSRAKAAGATILIEIKDEDYGGRGFTCRDPEGHIWSFGTYDPWGD
ncbi:VOC family protein [Ferrovibrio terrae]|uniref:VOC family protein n=1 Tax=Ferrovibrio terrae TaxID=2594003 RepID=UPI00313795AA